MGEFSSIDIGLFSVWPEGGDGFWSDTRRLRTAGIVLERKSAAGQAGAAQPEASPAEAYCRLLNDLTLEMRAQFELFRKLRASAEPLIDGAGEGGADAGDGVAAKLARADAKAATDAISLIVRTLEKVDSLQRQIARDRDDEAERQGEGEHYDENRDRLLALIERRAEERACALAAAAVGQHGLGRDGFDRDGGGSGGAHGAGDDRGDGRDSGVPEPPG